jgi:hypothetical protein
MMDAIGVNQHHDAVTGTCKQAVANDYSERIYDGIEKVNSVYTEAINYWAQQTGFEADNWQWCFRYNSTYLDCPISQYADSTDFKFIVAMHNPANLPLTIPSIAVPHGHLSV